MIDKMEKVMKQDGPIADLRKAIGELVLLQTLSSSLRENAANSTYTVKDTFSDDAYQSTIKLPLIQEIDIMQSINSNAQQFLEKRLQLMRETIQKRRTYERDLARLMELCPQWSLEAAKQQTRLPADLPESSNFSMDKDVLAFNCHWRPRPRIFHDPFYFAYLRMNPANGHVELHPTMRNNAIDKVALSLQISLQDTSCRKEIARLDLWQLMHASSHSNRSGEEAEAAHLTDIVSFCTALSHSSLAREVFYHLTEEVGQATNIVSMAGAAEAVVDDAQSKEGAHGYVKLAEQFSLCEQSNRVLRWQIADSLVLSIALVHLDSARLQDKASEQTAEAAMQVDDDGLEQHEQRIDDHWQQVIAYTFATLLGTFHASVAIQRKSDEIDKQWRHRSHEAEQQIVSRRTAVPPEPAVADATTSHLLSPQSMLVDAFKVLRIQHQGLYLRQLLHPVHGVVSQKLIAAGFIATTDGVRLQDASVASLPHESTTSSSSPRMTISQQKQVLLAWWRRHIAPLLSFTLTATYTMRLPSSGTAAVTPVASTNQSLPAPSCSVAVRPLSAGALDKDLVEVVQVIQDNVDAEEAMRGDVVTIGNVAPAMWQHVLQYTLRYVAACVVPPLGKAVVLIDLLCLWCRWLLTHRWASVVSTQWGWACRPSVIRSVCSCWSAGSTATPSITMTHTGDIGLAMVQRRSEGAAAAAMEDVQVVVTLVSTASSPSSTTLATQLLPTSPIQPLPTASSYSSDFDVLVGTLPSPSATQTVTVVPWSALL